MPRRVSTSISPSASMDSHEENVRRNPRRGAAQQKTVLTDKNDDNEESSSEEEPVSEEESSEEEAPRRRRQPRSSKPLSNQNSNRRSARANKFSDSLKEPTESVRDLVQPSTPSPQKSRGRGGAPKSPAVRHTSQRRRYKTEVHVESETDEDESESELEEDEDEIKIQRILASRSETRAKWKTICQNINTSEIDYGSRWFQDSDEENDQDFEERFLVKWSDLSYLHCSWETEEDLIDQVDSAKTYLTTFFRKSENGYLFTADERCDGDYFDPGYCQIDRILEVHEDEDNEIILDKQNEKFDQGTGRQFLIKWANLPYSEATFEFERDLILNEVEFEPQLQAFLERSKKPTKKERDKYSKSGQGEWLRVEAAFGDDSETSNEVREKMAKAYQKELEEHVFKNGGQVRDYQAEGVTFLLANHVNERGCILADEMGLGKTIQTAVYINTVARKLKERGPFLIVAPLSTIPHWYREFSAWTDLNTIIYHGSAQDREIIREQEMAYPADHPKGNFGFNQSFLRKCLPMVKRTRNKVPAPDQAVWMAEVVITTPETLVTNDYSELTNIHWEVLVVDEAHRLKNHTSKLANNLRDSRFVFGQKLLLTGTPIQNNMTELWTLLNIADPDKFDDMEKFLSRYGDIKSKERIDELHEMIRPYILRRLKEDVEKSVPPKEETLIEVELTVLQKTYYRALYEKNVQFLHRNKRKALDGPSISNLAMQLRKCCNHPFLLNGVEEEVRGKENDGDADFSEGDFLAKASGKLVLLDKLLPRLKEGGHRILIFSQFKIMLDILEDYLSARKFKFERIDGSITGNKRQIAIDRFQADASESKVENPFVMLLSTRAGGVGINLTAADTCIIFDSDWNPQNDLQAQARCHRIGQTKSVKVYRLLSRKTYEMQMFHMSSLKMGLDQAVLQGFENSSNDDGSNMTKEEVERLLRHGAYDIFNEEKAGNAEAESNDFVQQDIDSILERRSRTVIHDNTGSKSNAAGGTFSKASFKAAKTPDSGDKKANNQEDVDIDDPEFWKKMVGEAKIDDKTDLLSSKKRKRNKANYSERDYERRFHESIEGSDSEILSAGAESKSDDWSEDSSQEDDAASPMDSSEMADLTAGGGPKKKRAKKKKVERSKWGSEWERMDVEKLFKALQMYGYGNLPWEEFAKKVDFPVRSDYTIEQIKRMCWSLVLLVLREAADEDVVAAKKRAEKAALKKREADGTLSPPPSPSKGGVLGAAASASQQEDDAESDEKLLDISFKKLWDTHATWITMAVEDALSYAETNSPRPKDVLARALNEVKSTKTSVSDGSHALFVRNVWPPLKSRGWTSHIERVGEYAGVTIYHYNGKQYRSPEAVLRAVPAIHPELSNTAEQVLSSAALEAAEKERARKLESENARLESDMVTADSLSLFLQMYAPLPLVADRAKQRKMVLQRKVLSVCSSLHTANALVKRCQGDSQEEVTEQLEKLLCVQKRLALPHPSWTSKHDAVLVAAIAKHGWIDHDVCGRAITEDATIKWGAPFDEHAVSSTASSPTQLSQEEVDMKEKSHALLKRTATRAAVFFSSEYEMIKESKGFNQELVVKAYGLERVVDEDEDDTSKPEKWIVNDALLEQAVEGSSQTNGQADDGDADATDLADLPTKKELLRRAKAVLSRSSTSLSPPSATSLVPESDAAQSQNYKYCVLDQGDRCNILLAEMMRGLLKAPFMVNGTLKKESRNLCCHAAQEADSRADDLLEFEKKEASEAEATEGSAVSPSDEMRKIAHHISTEVRSNMNRSSRPPKNVLRVMLGMQPLPGKKEGDELFPIERSKLHVISTAKRKQGALGEPLVRVSKRKKAKETGAAGDAAITRAMARAEQAEEEGQPRRFSISGESQLLELTATEILILSVVCSQGLPVWTPHWNDLIETDEADPTLQGPGHVYAISWYGMGIVTAESANFWHSVALQKLQDKRKTFQDKFPKEEDRDTKEANRLLRRIKALELDEAMKRRAISTIKDYNSDPVKLAKKTVMLLEALRTRMGPVESKRSGAPSKKAENGLGPKVLQWLGKELTRWAQSLDITDHTGKPLANTGADFISEIPRYREDEAFSVAGVVDKKMCRALYSQISQQSRARSILLKNSEPEVEELVVTAVGNSRNAGESWDKPEWWVESPDASDSTGMAMDLELFTGLVEMGYSGFEEMLENRPAFRRHLESAVVDGSPSRARYGFSKACAQERMNQLTRELASLDDTASMLRMVQERRENRNGGNVNIVSDGADSSAKQSVQTGIQAFFARPKAKKNNVVIVLSDSDDVVIPTESNDDDDDSVELVSQPKAEKRKEMINDDAESPSPEKKLKST